MKSFGIQKLKIGFFRIIFSKLASNFPFSDINNALGLTMIISNAVGKQRCALQTLGRKEGCHVAMTTKIGVVVCQEIHTHFKGSSAKQEQEQHRSLTIGEIHEAPPSMWCKMEGEEKWWFFSRNQKQRNCFKSQAGSFAGTVVRKLKFFVKPP